MGFIIGDAKACGQCGRVTHPDGYPVTWTCVVCRKLVCRFCCLTGVDGAILLDTLCSKDCRIVLRAERALLDDPTVDWD